MSKEKKLINDTILYGIANFGASSLVFLMLPLYTRYFSPESYGTWDIALTSVTLVIPFVSFELTAATYRWLLDGDSATYDTIISTSFFQLLRHLFVFTSLALLVFMFISFAYQWEALFMMNVMILFSYMQQCARGLKRNTLFASLGILQTVIVVSCNLLFILVFKLGIEGLFYANSIAGTICTMIAWQKLRFHQFIKPSARSKALLKSYFTYAIPIIPAAASWWIMTMSDRWMIAAFLGVTMNGIYAVAIKIPAVLLMINTVFSLAWKDSAITSYHTTQKNEFYSTVFVQYFRLMATSVICLTLVAKPVIAYFIGPAFFHAWKYSGLLLVATLFHALALFWAAGFHGAKQTKAILSTSIVGAMLNVGINFLLIPFIGLYAVAISTLIAFLVTWLLRINAAKSYFTIYIHKKDVVLLSFLIGIALYIPFIANKISLTISICISLLLFIVYNKKMFLYVHQELVTKWHAILLRYFP